MVCIIAVTIIVFMLTHLSGDPLALLMDPEARPEDWEAKRISLGLDKPLYVQYWRYISGVFRGDFGLSLKWKIPAFELFMERFPNTLQLGVSAILITWFIGIPVGVLSALKPGGFVDRIIRVMAIFGQSVPVFWMAIMLILVFSVTLGLLPSAGRGGIRNLILPAVTLGAFSTAAMTRLSRSAMLDVMDREYIKLARIKGLPERLVIGKHALKNASIPVITLASMQFVVLINGTVITETIFAWPGVGRLIVDAINWRDFPIVQMCVFIASCLWIFSNLAIDILYAYLDPRIRYQ